MESTYRELISRLGKLADAMLILRVTAIEDRPRPGRSIIRLVDSYDAAVEEALGLSEEAFEAAVEGQKAAEHRSDFDRAGRAIKSCQERYNTLIYHFLSIVAADRELSLIALVGNEQGGNWTAWIKALKQAIDACWGPLLEVGRTIAGCLEEIRKAGGGQARLAEAPYHPAVEKLSDRHQTC